MPSEKQHFLYPDTLFHMNIFRCLVLTLLFVTPLKAQDNLTNVPDPDPEAQLAALHVAEGFEINLFATDPMIDPPIQMCWDEQGRLWVATSTSYPQPIPGQQPNDKIFVLEDLDGDGQADQSTLFADGLLTPTGIAVGDGGIYVANSTEILHLQDTNGDGQADTRRVVLSGFGADDTHHLIHSFRWGPDGLFYLNQSVYIYSHIETPWGVRRLRGGGIWQFDPATLRLEVLARGLWNPWGFDFDEWGQTFATDGAGFQGLHFIFPGVAYAPAHGIDRVLEGLNPGHPKYAGLALISGNHFPEEWHGNLITSDYRANRVKRFILTEDGSGFRAEEQDDLVWTDHVAFRPVDINQGPDGALYLADWYNPIIQHGEVDFRDPRRDHKHGRIWRITAKNRPLASSPSMQDVSVAQLLETLKLPEEGPRRHAKRLLKERGTEAVRPVLDSWVRELDRQAPDATHHLLEALWAYQAIGTVQAPLLREVLASEDYRARAAALRVLLHWQEKIEDSDAILSQAVSDPHPRVRREAVTVLGRRQTAEAALMALTALDHPMDSFLDYALWHTLRELAPAWTPHLADNPAFLGNNLTKTVFALQAVDEPIAIERLTQLYQDDQIPESKHADVLDTIVSKGDDAALQAIYTLALNDVSIGPNDQLAHLKSLEGAARDHGKIPPHDHERLQTLLDGNNIAVRMSAAHLTGRWKVTALRGRLQALAEDTQQRDNLRRAALQGLAYLGDEESQRYITMLVGAEQPDNLSLWAASFLPAIDVQVAAQALAGFLQKAQSSIDPVPLFEAFFRQEGGNDALAEAIQAAPIPVDFAQQGLDKIQGYGPSFDTLRQAFEASGAVAVVPRMQLDPGFYESQRLEHDVKASGDVVRGEAIYRRPSLVCARCHAIGNAGGKVGPDLTSIGVTAPTDYLITSLLKPEQAVKDGYALVRITRKDGSLVSGILTQETSNALIVRDAADQVITVPNSQVQSREVVPGSLMPAGLMAQLDRSEFVDLVAFLSALGDDDAYRVPRTPHVRTWRVLQSTESTLAQLVEDGPDAVVLQQANLDWATVFSMTDGTLPLEEVPTLDESENSTYSFVQFDLDVKQAGSATFRIPHSEALSVWMGTETIEIVANQLVLDLPEGIHIATIAIDRSARPRADLFIELIQDATTAQVTLGAASSP